MLAHGKTIRGREFTREQVLSGAVWQGGDQPPPSARSGRASGERWHGRVGHLLECLWGEGVIRPELEKRLREVGLDVAPCGRCMQVWCRDAPSRNPAPRPVWSTSPGAAGRDTWSRRARDTRRAHRGRATPSEESVEADTLTSGSEVDPVAGYGAIINRMYDPSNRLRSGRAVMPADETRRGRHFSSLGWPGRSITPQSSSQTARRPAPGARPPMETWTWTVAGAKEPPPGQWHTRRRT